MRHHGTSRFIRLAGAAGLVAGATLGATSTAANADHVDETVVVTEKGATGDLSIPEYGEPSTTPTTFTAAASSIGSGSLLVEPIGSAPADKFIGYVAYDGMPASEFESLSVDFQLASGIEDVQDFYLNVYAITEAGETFYNCRYDQVATTGTEDGFTTLSVNADEPTTSVTTRKTASECPATIAELPEGSTINYAAINVGQSTASDEGTSGYLDNVIVDNELDSTAYDLEKIPASKDDCKNGGFAFTGGEFENQGECVASFAKQSNSGKKG